jgi:hypothetical protein
VHVARTPLDSTLYRVPTEGPPALPLWNLRATTCLISLLFPRAAVRAWA